MEPKPILIKGHISIVVDLQFQTFNFGVRLNHL